MRILALALAVWLTALGPAPIWAQNKAPQTSGTPALEEPLRPEDFQTVFPLEKVAEGGLNRVALSPDIFLSCQRPDLADLAVFNGRGELSPALLIETGPRVEDLPAQSYDLPFFPMSRGGDSGSAPDLLYETRGGRLELKIKAPGEASERLPAPESFVLDASVPAGRGESAGELVLVWKAEGPEVQARRLKLESSADLRQWRTVAGEATVLGSDPAATGSQLQARLALPALERPYLRLTWLDEGRRPDLVSVRWAGAPRRAVSGPEELKAEWPGRLEKDQEGRPALVYEFDGWPPIAALNLKLTEAASFRSILWGRNPGDERWTVIGSVASYRYARPESPGVFENNPSWPLNWGTYRYYRLTPYGAWPAFDQAPNLEVEFRPRELVFLAQGGGPYQLAVGLRLAVVPPPLPPAATRFDPARPSAALGAPIKKAARSEDTGGLAPKAGAEDESPLAVWLFRGVLALGLLILTMMALKLYRQTQGKL